jgi:hypothetical protein
MSVEIQPIYTQEAMFEKLFPQDTRRAIRFKELLSVHLTSVDALAIPDLSYKREAEFAAALIACQTVLKSGTEGKLGHVSMCFAITQRNTSRILLSIYETILVLTTKFGYKGEVISFNKNESITFKTRTGSTNEVFCYKATPENLPESGSKGESLSVFLVDGTYYSRDLTKKLFSVFTPDICSLIIFSRNVPVEFDVRWSLGKRYDEDSDDSDTTPSKKIKTKE